MADDPHPFDAIKLTGNSGLWRIRIADYRIAYLIDDKLEKIDIRIVAHRREIYRDL